MSNLGCIDDQTSQELGLPGRPNSIWLDTIPETNYPSYSGNRSVETVVIGGGMVGLATALPLVLAGQEVIVIESRQIATGVTGFTTGKLTSLHTLIYNYLIEAFGEEQARIYGEANQWAIQWMEELVGTFRIECDFERMPAYTYTVNEDRMPEIRAEWKIAKRLGLPAELIEHDVPLPFPTAGAIRFTNQARFHPGKFLLALADIIQQNGGEIFENSRVIKVDDGDPHKVILNNGVITAKNIVVATNFPVYDPLQFYARMKPRRSLALGALLNQPMIQGMFISVEDRFHSLRPHPYTDDEEMLIIGSEMYRVGENEDVVEKYKSLERWARQHFDIKSIELHWATHDQEPFDRVPFIGQFNKNIFGATGFKGWGLTHSLAASRIISDLIMGESNPWAKLYDPHRPQLAKKPKETSKNLIEVGKEFLEGKIGGEKEGTVESIPQGEGQVININGEETAVYKDDSGQLHAVSATCTHMGCTVGWNNAEKSWDCPCHGSRYDCYGKVLRSPTVEDLPPETIRPEE